jgi:hypothetical protein
LHNDGQDPKEGVLATNVTLRVADEKSVLPRVPAMFPVIPAK